MKWFTKEYWNQREAPPLVWGILLLVFALMFVYFPKLLEYLTRPE